MYCDAAKTLKGMSGVNISLINKSVKVNRATILPVAVDG